MLLGQASAEAWLSPYFEILRGAPLRLARESRPLSNNSHRRGRRSRRPGAAEAGLPLETLYFSSRSGRRGRPGNGHDTKSLQLCRQVQRRLDLALGELDDPLLQGLWVRAVIPEPGGRSLLVEVVSSGGAAVHEILERLDAARGHLRSEVAAAIHRKRTPHLQFMVVPQTPLQVEHDEEGEP